MKFSPSVITGIFFAALLLVLLFRAVDRGGGFPPHEFAYGTALRGPEAISEQINKFLSLDDLDPGQIQIRTFAGNQNARNLTPLIAYISAQNEQRFQPLIIALKAVDQLPNQKEKAIQLVKTLLPYKETLRNDSQQDSIIVFVYYGLKQPSSLSDTARAKVTSLVKQLDTTKQSTQFDSGVCPNNYLVGNINVYPLGLDNTSWHHTVDFTPFPKEAPVLEIRFMGLRGVFRYLLDEMTAKTGDSFLHLDGESI